jgi:hypothetical protein
MADIPQTSIESVIREAIDSALKEVHTVLPAVVISVNNTAHTVNVQPTIKRKIAGKLVLLPVLQNVPIRHLRTSVFSITIPIKAADHVMLLCSERSIDTWLTEGDIQNPFDVRKFSLNDAFAIPMMYHQKEIASEPIDASNLEIKINDGKGDITLQADGSVILRNNNGDFKLSDNGDIHLNGSSDFVVAFNDMKAAFDQLKSDYNSHMATYNSHFHYFGGSPTSTPSATASATNADMSGAKVSDVKVT